MFKESMQEFIDQKLLMNDLTKCFTEFACYKTGIIDGYGNKLKDPITEEEKSSYGPYTKTIIRIKKYLGPKIDLFEAEMSLNEHTNKPGDIVEYKKMLDYQDKISANINNLYKIIEEAQQSGLSIDLIKQLIKA